MQQIINTSKQKKKKREREETKRNLIKPDEINKNCV